MKKRARILIGLALVLFLTWGWASYGSAQESDISYESFDSFDPSGDFDKNATKKSAAPPRRARNQPSASGEMGKPYQGQGTYEASPPQAVERPAPAGFDMSEPVSYDSAPPASAPRAPHSGFDLSEPDSYDAAPPASAPRATHSGFDLSEPGTYETGPVADITPPQANSGFDLSDPNEAPASPAAVETAPAPAMPAPAPAVKAAPAVPVSAAPPVALSEAVNYSHPDNWLSLPSSPARSVDVFFLYTGSCNRVGQGGAVCSTNDPGMRQKAQASLRQQAGVFEPIANIYAPYYRQTNSSIFLGLGDEDRSGRLAVSSADSMAAFDYYLKNHNKGRPFILAAHGQGSAALLSGILSSYLKSNPEVRSRMVAAYALGYSVTSSYLAANDHLHFAQRRNDTGVIISYNTEAPDLTAPSPTLLPRAVAINPVNWARSEIPAKADRSLGANLSAFGGEEQVEKFADARISLRRGVVECSTADQQQYSTDDLFPQGAYPEGDYAFYFYDLRANAQERVDAFMQGRGQ